LDGRSVHSRSLQLCDCRFRKRAAGVRASDCAHHFLRRRSDGGSAGTWNGSRRARERRTCRTGNSFLAGKERAHLRVAGE